jgi:cephalosporin hydroxylase
MNFQEFKNLYCSSTPNKEWMTENIQGWNSTSPALLYALDQAKPKTIVEVGTWLGASAIFMAENSQAEIIAVDTYLASNEILWREKNVEDLVNNFSKIYDQFCANITFKNLNNRISPLPMTSSSAAELFQKQGIRIDMAYIDAGHREREVYADLQDWWPIVDKVLVGDDYNASWPGVISAAKRFANEKDLDLQIMDSKFLLWR